jgi:hypothetical protein
MTRQPTWKALARDFKRLDQTLRADWFATEGREEYGIWLLRPDSPDSHDDRISFSLIAAKALEKSGTLPKPLPQPLQHDPQWDLFCQSIDLSDAVPYGLGEVDRDAVDPCTRAWLDLLRGKSSAFRSSEGMSWVKGTEYRTYTGSIRNVSEASATHCTLRARDEIEARLMRRSKNDKNSATESRSDSPKQSGRRGASLESPSADLPAADSDTSSNYEGGLVAVQPSLTEQQQRMTILPELPEPVKRKHAVEWEDLVESKGFDGDHLLWHSRERDRRARISAQASPSGTHMGRGAGADEDDKTAIPQTLSLATSRLQQYIGDYWSIWTRQRIPNSTTFGGWLEAMQRAGDRGGRRVMASRRHLAPGVV